MQCPKCGYNNPDDALFCNLCHAVFRKESPKTPEVSFEEERYNIMHKHREGGGWKRWLGLDVWLSLIVIIVVAFWATNTVMKQREKVTKPHIVKEAAESGINSGSILPATKTQTLSIKRETAHFVIYSNDEQLANDVASKVENYYHIPIDLGFVESNFWMKDKVHIYIYDTPQEYVNITGKASWSSAYSDFKSRVIYSYKDIPYLADAVIPHELTHLIFADFINFSDNYPKWLSEGLAMYQETKYCKAYIDTYQKILDQIKGGKYLSVDDLTKIDISREKNIELIHFWYVESMSIVTYLIDVHGRGRLYTFCKNLREGMNLNEALKDAYSPHIQSLPELTGQWLSYIKTNQ